jgi:DNA repair exonuclease SbcCD ATPase subunit
METATNPNSADAQTQSPDAATQASADEKRFSQAELESTLTQRLARERASAEKKIAEATRAEQQKAEAIRAELEELKSRLDDTGKSGSEKQIAEAQRALTKQQQALEDTKKLAAQLQGERDAAVQKFTQYRVGQEVQSALLNANAIPSTVADAALIFQQTAKIELDETGAINCELGGRNYDTVKEAIDAFLASKPHFRAHPGGGAGTRNSGTGAFRGQALSELSGSELLAASFSKTT